MKRIVSIVLFGTLFAASSFAQSDSVGPKAKQGGATKDSQQASNEMQEKNEQSYERLKEKLKEKDPAAWNRLRAQEILDAQEALASFGYGTIFTATLDEKTTEALRNYQTRNGLPVTGDVDTATQRHLTKDKSDLSEPSNSFGPLYLFGDTDWNSFVMFMGAWFEQGKEPNAQTPLFAARVECLKSAGLCVAATELWEGSIQLDWYEIQKWDQYEIVTKSLDLLCRRKTIHISRPDKTLLMIDTAAYKNVELCTQLGGPPRGAIVSRFVDGSKIMNARFDARLDAYRAASNRIKLISAEAESRVR